MNGPKLGRFPKELIELAHGPFEMNGRGLYTVWRRIQLVNCLGNQTFGNPLGNRSRGLYLPLPEMAASSTFCSLSTLKRPQNEMFYEAIMPSLLKVTESKVFRKDFKVHPV